MVIVKVTDTCTSLQVAAYEITAAKAQQHHTPMRCDDKIIDDVDMTTMLIN